MYFFFLRSICLVFLVSLLFPAYNPSPILQRSLLFPDLFVTCSCFVGVLFFYCWSFLNVSIGVTK